MKAEILADLPAKYQAAVHIALKDYGKAIKKCTDAMALDPRNVKIYLRRAKAYTGRGEGELSKKDLDQVIFMLFRMPIFMLFRMQIFML